MRERRGSGCIEEGMSEWKVGRREGKEGGRERMEGGKGWMVGRVDGSRHGERDEAGREGRGKINKTCESM